MLDRLRMICYNEVNPERLTMILKVSGTHPRGSFVSLPARDMDHAAVIVARYVAFGYDCKILCDGKEIN